MKTPNHICITSILLLSFLAACTIGVSPDSQQDTVNTAIAGTQMAEVLAQATVNANTLTAMPATPTPGPTIEYVTLTEEELVALIDQAVAEAVSACEQTTQAASTAAGVIWSPTMKSNMFTHITTTQTIIWIMPGNFSPRIMICTRIWPKK